MHVEENPLMVVKSDGRRQAYDHDKLKSSLIIACKKRPIPTSKIDEIVLQVENKMRDKSQDEIKSREIGEMVIKYLRFASVYRNFQDKEEFMSEIKGLKE